MKLYYIANARMPTEKAHGIQIAKMCEAFIEAGLDVALVVPTRKTVPESVQEFYKLRTPVNILRLPVPDLYLRGIPGYRASSFIFMVEYVLLLWWKKIQGERFAMYTVDLDNFSSSALALVPGRMYSEMHGAKPDTFIQRMLFRKAKGVIAINSIIERELKETFAFSCAQYLVEPNGVDAGDFRPIEKNKARALLGLPAEEKIVLYAGRFFDWKGLEILTQSAAQTPDLAWYMVGGTREHFAEFVNETPPPNVHFVGNRPHSEITSWLSAADALIVLGTKRDIQSYYYTSPMKIFEYLLAKRPIVASNTPAISQIVSEDEVFFYEPDNAEDLAEKVSYAIGNADAASYKIVSAEAKGRQFSWKARAARILDFISK